MVLSNVAEDERAPIKENHPNEGGFYVANLV